MNEKRVLLVPEEFIYISNHLRRRFCELLLSLQELLVVGELWSRLNGILCCKGLVDVMVG